VEDTTIKTGERKVGDTTIKTVGNNRRTEEKGSTDKPRRRDNLRPEAEEPRRGINRRTEGKGATEEPRREWRTPL
jgi:hypothetical protein